MPDSRIDLYGKSPEVAQKMTNDQPLVVCRYIYLAGYFPKLEKKRSYFELYNLVLLAVGLNKVGKICLIEFHIYFKMLQQHDEAARKFEVKS